MSFEQWISDGTVLSRVMRTISFNSVEEEIGGNYGSSEDIIRSRVRIYRINLKLTTWLMQIRNLICQIRAYGVSEKCLFSENDLLLMSNTPRVAKCLREIAVIVSFVITSLRNNSL